MALIYLEIYRGDSGVQVTSIPGYRNNILDQPDWVDPIGEAIKESRSPFVISCHGYTRRDDVPGRNVISWFAATQILERLLTEEARQEYSTIFLDSIDGLSTSIKDAAIREENLKRLSTYLDRADELGYKVCVISHDINQLKQLMALKWSKEEMDEACSALEAITAEAGVNDTHAGRATYSWWWND